MSSKPGWGHTDRFLPPFFFLDFMITTITLKSLRSLKQQLNPCKTLALCVVIFTFWNYFKLMAFQETRTLMTLWKFSILSVKYLQFMMKNGWLVESFPAYNDWISCDHRDALFLMWISSWLPDLLSVISCSEMWHFPQLIFAFSILLTAIKIRFYIIH